MKKSSKYYFDKAAADHAVRWIEKYITHAQGDMKGQPFKLEEFQKRDLIEPLFGWKDKITKFRRYKTVFLFIPKKNGKSTLVAALSLYVLMGLKAVGTNVIVAAADRNQAGIVFNDLASVMVQQNKQLEKRAEVYRNSIVYSGRAMKVISSDAKTKHGFIPYMIVIDEVHAHPNKELIDTLRTGVVGRDEPIVFYLTTAGYDSTSVAYELYDYAKKVKSGEIIDETFLPVIYEADKDMDIFDEKTWKTANPGFGKMVKRHYFVEETNKIKNQPSYESTFRRLHLNQWVGAEETWVSDADWMKCSGSGIDEKNYKDFIKQELEKRRGQTCVLGLDLASVSDINALVAMFPSFIEDKHGTQQEYFDIFPFFWLPMDTAIRRTKSADVDYLEWGRQGLIELTEGNSVDYNLIKDKILWLYENYDIEVFGYDKWNSSQLIIDLKNAAPNLKFDPVQMYLSIISAPTKELERRVMSGLINHFANPILRWMMGNVMIKTDTNGNIRPDKNKSKNKIDGIIACIIALAAHMSKDYNDPNLVYSGEIDI